MKTTKFLRWNKQAENKYLQKQAEIGVVAKKHKVVGFTIVFNNKSIRELKQPNN